jgi:uncharacterized protein (DUF4415 family)
MNEEYAPSWDTAATATVQDAPARSPGAPQLKQIVTIRLDVDTLAWFKSGGPGYQTRINQILRDHMQEKIASSDKAG